MKLPRNEVMICSICLFTITLSRTKKTRVRLAVPPEQYVRGWKYEMLKKHCTYSKVIYMICSQIWRVPKPSCLKLAQMHSDRKIRSVRGQQISRMAIRSVMDNGIVLQQPVSAPSSQHS